MTSKEALENLYNMACVEAGQKQQFITYAREIEHNENVKKHYDIIKQDLERLKQLEKENQDLKEKLQLTETARQLIYNELKCCSGMSEYIEKLKKAIDILKNIIILPIENDISRVDNKGNNYYILRYIKRLLNEQEYELLKEVLENDK